jgi:hypothetical protein
MGSLRATGCTNVQRQLQYLIQWIGYDAPSWEPAESVNGVWAIDLFHEQYPVKLGPLSE